jgi:hypothetical protein
MSFQVDIWLRGTDVAATAPLEGIDAAPESWTDDDVRLVLEAMLRAMYRLKHPADAEFPIALRGLSWIVNPFDDGGVVIAIEITLGAAIAGPFSIDQATLESMITRVLARPAAAVSPTIH